MSFFAGFPADVPLYELDFLWCNKITDKDLVYISELTQLHKVSFWCGADIGLSHLSKLYRLTSISLGSPEGRENITDNGLVHLSKLYQLEELDLIGCDITDNGLFYLKDMSRLKKIDLANCDKINGCGFEYMKGLSELESLDLSVCFGLTDDGLSELSKLGSLLSLDLTNCDNIQRFQYQIVT